MKRRTLKILDLGTGLTAALALLLPRALPAAPAKPAPPMAALGPKSVAPPAKVRVATLDLVTTESDEVTALAVAPEPMGRLFVVEKKGLIRILRGNTFAPKPFLDLQGKVAIDKRDNGEQGLLGLAFHPQFKKNGLFYINYTDLKGGTTHVEERRVDKKNRDRADDTFVRLLLSVDQPYTNHNAGDLTFGPDGKLYLGLGDGGSANDPHGNGQNENAMLGKMLRMDVAANPPVIEKIAIGVRNPWRISFDAQAGDLYIADVGQNQYEYVHVLTAAQLKTPGIHANLGWNVMEGFHCFQGARCDPAPFQKPLIEYDHQTGCSITGGYVYRGKALPELQGHYFYADYCTAIVRSFKLTGGAVSEAWDWKPILDPESRLARVSAFGQDQNGELYIATHEGPIYKLVRAKAAAKP